MESLYLLIPLSIILAFIMGYFFWWSAKNGQFDDLKGPAHRILMDNDEVEVEDKNKESLLENETEQEDNDQSLEPQQNQDALDHK